jgi:hypothetical protein
MAGMSGGNVTKAVFINLEGGGPFQVQYNPTAFQYDKAVTWQEHEAQGTDKPSPIEFQKNSPATLSMDLLFDTTNEGGDVREKWVNGILFLTNPMVKPSKGEAGKLDKKRPPRVTFMWSSFKFTGVIASANVTYLMFASSGTPVRANRQRLRVHLVLVLGFFLGGLMGALGFKYWGYITTVPLAALLWVLCLRPLLDDLRWRAA